MRMINRARAARRVDDGVNVPIRAELVLSTVVLGDRLRLSGLHGRPWAKKMGRSIWSTRLMASGSPNSGGCPGAARRAGPARDVGILREHGCQHGADGESRSCPRSVTPVVGAEGCGQSLARHPGHFRRAQGHRATASNGCPCPPGQRPRSSSRRPSLPERSTRARDPAKPCDLRLSVLSSMRGF